MVRKLPNSRQNTQPKNTGSAIGTATKPAKNVLENCTPSFVGYASQWLESCQTAGRTLNQRMQALPSEKTALKSLRPNPPGLSVQELLWAWGYRDWSTPSFSSHHNPISTRGADYAPPLPCIDIPPTSESHRRTTITAHHKTRFGKVGV